MRLAESIQTICGSRQEARKSKRTMPPTVCNIPERFRSMTGLGSLTHRCERPLDKVIPIANGMTLADVLVRRVAKNMLHR